MKREKSTPAYLLRSVDYGESDRILTFFSRQEGKLRGMARGAKRSRRRFGGALDWFHLVKLTYRPGRGELCHLEDLEVLESGEKIARHLQAFGFGCYFLELTYEFTKEHHEDLLIFDLLHLAMKGLHESVTQMESASRFENLARFFEMQLLDLAGFRPVLDFCVVCQKPVPRDFFKGRGETLSFSVERGGLLCTPCLRRQHRAAQTLPVLSQEAWEAMRECLAFFEKTPHEVIRIASLPQFSPSANRQARRVLLDVIRSHTQKNLLSMGFLETLPFSPEPSLTTFSPTAKSQT